MFSVTVQHKGDNNMKITVDDIQELTELLKEAETFRPIINEIINVLKSYSNELKFIPNSINEWITQNRINTINQYKDAGFNHDDAILMTLDDIYSIQKLQHKINNKKG